MGRRVRVWACKLVLVVGVAVVVSGGLTGCGDARLDELPPWLANLNPRAEPATAEPTAVQADGQTAGGSETAEGEDAGEQTAQVMRGRTTGAATTLAPPPDTNRLVRVGLLLPLSGSAGGVGEAILNAGQIALFDAADQRFVLQPYDTKGTPDGAREAAALALSHGVDLILGPLFSHSVRAVAPQARAGGVSVVAFSTDSTVAGDGVWVLGYLLRDQISRVTGLARSRGAERFTIMAPDTAYGRAAVDAMRETASVSGVTLVASETYDFAAGTQTQVARRVTDYDARRARLQREISTLEGRTDAVSKRALERLERLDTIGPAPFDAVMIPDDGGSLRAVAALLPFYDVDLGRVQLLGTMKWSDDAALNGEPALVGGWYPAADPARQQAFSDRYRRLYGETPSRLASLGYDAVALAAVLARSGGQQPDFSARTLSNPNGFMGVDGIFRLLPDGTNQRGLAVMEVTADGRQVVDPAPTTFQIRPMDRLDMPDREMPEQ